MKIINNSKILMRLVAADKLRLKGFEVYSFPMSPMRHLPDLVAYRNGRFYNVYLFKSREAREAEFSDRDRRLAFEYAEPLGAAVASIYIHLVQAK